MLRWIASVALAALPALAQAPPGFFNWWDSPVAKDLNLSEDQTRQIRAIVREYREKLIDQRGALQKAEAQFGDLFAEGGQNQQRANEVIERLVAARGELTRTMSQMTLRLRGVLAPEQFQKLQERRPMVRPAQPLRPRLRDFQQRRQGRLPVPPAPPAPPAPQKM